MKINRHAKILDLIGRYEIETQEMLLEYLAREGVHVAQSTVCRDIRDLRLEKVPASTGKLKYAQVLSPEEELKKCYLHMLREGYEGMDLAENILVIRTVSGMAMAFGASLDAMNFPEEAGSIAGDDTVFCAAHTEEEAQILLGKIREIVSK